MGHRLLLAGSCALALAGTAAALQKPPEPTATEAVESTDETAAQQAAAEEIMRRQKAETDAQIEAHRAAQEAYEQSLRDGEAERVRYEEGLARHQQELERLAAERAAYDRQIEEYNRRYGSGGGSGGANRNEAAADAGDRTTEDRVRSDREVQREPAASGESCERQQRRNRNRGRVIGGLIGGIAAIAGGDELGPGALALVPAGALLGDAIAGLLDCDEQERAAAATERAVAGGVGTTESWTSETRPGVSGSSTVVALEPEAGGGECMTVTDIIIVDGEETRAPKRLCRRPPSNRFVRV